MLGCVFLFAWWAVFDVAIMNGDDVVHFASALHGVLAPKFHSAWTPNRIIDIYGRTLFSSIFSFTFFSINGIIKVSFFTLYKLVSASFFAVFVTCSFSYFLKKAAAPETNRGFKLMFSLFFAVVTLQVFFWKNQVHFICYQLPGFLTFVLLKMTFEAKERKLSDSAFTGFLFLSYLCNFSLESFTLTIFIFSLFLLLLEMKANTGLNPARLWTHLKQNSYSRLLLINLFFGSISLLITVLFSDRSKGVASANFVGGIRFFLESRMMPIGIVLLLLCVAVLVLKARRKPERESDFAYGFYFALYLGAAVLISTYLISAKSNTNYFDMESYPWGDLMLVGKLALVYLVGISVARLASRAPRFQPVLALVLIVLFSRLIYFFFDHVEKDSIASVQAGRVYAAVAAGSTDAITTGFDLDAIPMPVRPFPTASSPQWFKDSYRATFAKYYGIKVLPDFR